MTRRDFCNPEFSVAATSLALPFCHNCVQGANHQAVAEEITQAEADAAQRCVRPGITKIAKSA